MPVGAAMHDLRIDATAVVAHQDVQLPGAVLELERDSDRSPARMRRRVPRSAGSVDGIAWSSDSV